MHKVSTIWYNARSILYPVHIVMTFYNVGTTGCARVVCRPGTVCRESSVGVLCPVLGPCEKKVECVPEGKTNSGSLLVGHY